LVIGFTERSARVQRATCEWWRGILVIAVKPAHAKTVCQQHEQ